MSRSMFIGTVEIPKMLPKFPRPKYSPLIAGCEWRSSAESNAEQDGEHVEHIDAGVDGDEDYRSSLDDGEDEQCYVGRNTVSQIAASQLEREGNEVVQHYNPGHRLKRISNLGHHQTELGHDGQNNHRGESVPEGDAPEGLRPQSLLHRKLRLRRDRGGQFLRRWRPSHILGFFGRVTVRLQSHVLGPGSDKQR